jgi:hypothetical protein
MSSNRSRGREAWCLCVVLVATTATASADRNTEHLTCYRDQNQPMFSIGLREGDYVSEDLVRVRSFDNTLMLPFAEKNEERLKVNDSSLNLVLKPGSCTISKTDPAHLATCRFTGEDADHGTHFSFTWFGPSAEGAPQTAVITRVLMVQSVLVTVEVKHVRGNQGLVDRAFATVAIKATVGGKPRTLTFTRDVGEWTSRTDRSDFDRCLISSGSDRR